MNDVSRERYIEKGWTFFPHETEGKPGRSWAFRSPRMRMNGFIEDGFTEEALLKSERTQYVHDRHGAEIDIAFAGEKARLVGELVSAYRYLDEKGLDHTMLPVSFTSRPITISLDKTR